MLASYPTLGMRTAVIHILRACLHVPPLFQCSLGHVEVATITISSRSAALMGRSTDRRKAAQLVLFSPTPIVCDEVAYTLCAACRACKIVPRGVLGEPKSKRRVQG